jgi:hypothetical protein
VTGDVIFLIAAGLAPGLFCAALVLMFTTPQPRWVRAGMVGLGAFTVVTFALYAVLWTRAFAYVDVNRAVPQALAVWSDIALLTWAVTGAATVILASTRLIFPRRATPRSETYPSAYS